MKNDDKVLSKELQMLREIVPALGRALGPFYEVVLHDFSKPERSIIAIEGNLTGRHVGGSVTNVVLPALKGESVEHMLGYKTVLKDGRVLKSSTIFVRDVEGKVIGAICINFDLSAIQSSLSMLNSLAALTEEEKEEVFPTNVSELVSELIDRVIGSFYKPVAFLNREEKIQIVRQLDHLGLFLIRGAIDAVADALSISRATVYSYLEEIRGKEMIGDSKIND